MALKLIQHPDATRRTFRTKVATATRPAGTLMNRYLVTGTPEEIARYKLARGQFYLEENEGQYAGQPIQNSQDYYDKPMNLVFTRDNGIAVAIDNMDVQLHGAMRKARQFGAGVMSHVEKNVADVIMHNISTPASTTAPAVSTTPAPATPAPIVTPEQDESQEELEKVNASADDAELNR